jgi:hypothetical protein
MIKNRYSARLAVALTALLAGVIVVAQEQPLPAPVLPEGSFIAAARGTMHRTGPKQPWVFRIDSVGDEDARQNLTLLPTSLLEEMEQNQSRSEDTIDFTVSGPVLLYRGRNYLLPQHVEMETDHSSRPGTSNPVPDPVESAMPPDQETESVDEADDFDPIDQGDSIASIVSQLQEDVGPLKRSVARDQPLIETPEGTSEGDLLLSRRGRILRDRSGAWVVVLDADASGLMDPTMILLPSSKLVGIENWARRGGIGRSIVISGEAFSYRGRHFLLPSAWRLPIERPNLK